MADQAIGSDQGPEAEICSNCTTGAFTGAGTGHNRLSAQRDGALETACEHTNTIHNWQEGEVLLTCVVQGRVEREELVEQSRKKGYRYLWQKSHGPEPASLGIFICSLCKHEAHTECSVLLVMCPLASCLSIDTECSSDNFFPGLKP